MLGSRAASGEPGRAGVLKSAFGSYEGVFAPPGNTNLNVFISCGCKTILLASAVTNCVRFLSCTKAYGSSAKATFHFVWLLLFNCSKVMEPAAFISVILICIIFIYSSSYFGEFMGPNQCAFASIKSSFAKALTSKTTLPELFKPSNLSSKLITLTSSSFTSDA